MSTNVHLLFCQNVKLTGKNRCVILRLCLINRLTGTNYFINADAIAIYNKTALGDVGIQNLESVLIQNGGIRSIRFTSC